MKSSFQCPLCHGRQYQSMYVAKDRMFELPGNFTVVMCRACRLVSLSPMPSQKQLERYYPTKKYYAYASSHGFNFFSSLRGYLLRHYYSPTIISRFLSLFLPKVPAIPVFFPHGKVLDVGCGSGDTLVFLRSLGWETYGVDIDKRAIAVAKRRGIDHARVGSYRDIGRFPDAYFDAIRLYHVIEHLDDPALCLRLIRKKLKKGGQLIIGTPNIESFIAAICGTYWYNLDAPRHLCLFSPQTLSVLVTRTDMKVESIEFCSAGGILGSIQYIVAQKFGVKLPLIHMAWLVVMMYPLEWFIDLLGLGDVFVVRAKNK